MARRKKAAAGEEGAPTWVVTFADLMSLLLTFFVLLLSFSSVSEQDFNQAMGSLKGALGVLDGLNSPLNLQSAARARQKSEAENERAARRLRRRLQVEGLEKEVKIEYDAKGGLRITLPNAILFDIGSAALQPAALPVLQDIAEVLADMPETFIEVQGHTDTTPTGDAGQFRDNYDLSYFRAHAVADRLIAAGGVDEDHLEIAAMGPSRPAATNTTESGRQANRRVEIHVRGLVAPDRMNVMETDEEIPALPAPETSTPATTGGAA